MQKSEVKMQNAEQKNRHWALGIGHWYRCPMPNAQCLVYCIVHCACCLVFAGCATKGYERYIPSEGDARKALETALTAWQNGGRPGEIGAEPTPVQVVDSRWQAALDAGRKLTGFEILKQEGGDGPKVFSVRLTLTNPDSQVTARYFVLGTGPVWVYLDEDFKKISET